MKSEILTAALILNEAGEIRVKMTDSYFNKGLLTK